MKQIKLNWPKMSCYSRELNLKSMFLFLAISFYSLNSFGQDRSISGKISDGKDNTGIPGSSVLIKGTTRGVVADANGNYKISVPNNAVLVISSVGFLTQEIAVGNRSEINASLATDLKALDEVVVKAMALNQKEKLQVLLPQ